VGCYPWHWYGCLHDGKKHGEYRQTLQHDGENVSQKPLDAVWETVRPFSSVSEPDSFRAYYRRFWGRLRKDAAPWARDNIAFAGFMFLAPTVAVYIHDRNHSIDWDLIRTTLWIYLGALTIYLGYHAIRTPWKLSLEEVNVRPAITFGAEVYELAEAISEFAFERSENAPEMPRFGSFNETNSLQGVGDMYARMAACNKWDSDTLGIYEYKFRRKIITVIRKLEDTRVIREGSDEFWSKPKNCTHIQLIGKTLADFADLIPEPENRITKTIDKD
jgi:hypothetical protein